jgi:hypothetical protein
MIGLAMFARLSDTIMKRLASRNQDGEMKPEYRLPPSMLGGICVPISLFWFGWSAEAKLHWIMPIIGTSFLGLGNCLIFVS